MTTSADTTEATRASGSLAGLDRVVASMREAVRRYVDVVRTELGSSLSSLTLFGPVLGQPFDPDASPAESVLVVERLDLPLLRRLAAHGPKLGKLGFSAPLVMTEKYIRASLDTFPLELIEIQQRRVTLLGADAFADLSFESAHVRLQCERELKRVLAGLTHGLLASAGREKAVAPLEREAGRILLRTLRGMLWIADQREFVDWRGTITRVESSSNCQLPAVRKAIDPSTALHWQDFDALFQEVQTLGESVNAL